MKEKEYNKDFMHITCTIVQSVLESPGVFEILENRPHKLIITTCILYLWNLKHILEFEHH